MLVFINGEEPSVFLIYRQDEGGNVEPTPLLAIRGSDQCIFNFFLRKNFIGGKFFQPFVSFFHNQSIVFSNHQRRRPVRDNTQCSDLRQRKVIRIFLKYNCDADFTPSIFPP